MIEVLEQVSYPLVTSTYDDAIDEVSQAFNYKDEWQRQSWATPRQTVRLLSLLVLIGATGIQAWVFLEELSNFSYLALFAMYGVHAAIVLTMLSVSPALERDSREAVLVRKWTHWLNSILFFVYLWQSLIYFTVLRGYFDEQRLKQPSLTVVIDLNQRVLLMPHLCFLVNFAVTDMVLLSKHGMQVLKLYSLYHVWGYIQRHPRDILTQKGMLDVTIYTGFIAAVSLP